MPFLARSCVIEASSPEGFFFFSFSSLLSCAAQPWGLGLSEDKACVYILYLDVFL